MRFAVIGGDLRQIHMSGLLADDGFEVCAAGFDRDVELLPGVGMRAAAEAVSQADCVVLPLPYSVDGVNVNAPYSKAPLAVEDVLAAAKKGALIVGGKLPPAFFARAEKSGLRAVDYYAREELAVLNTIPTAEGAIQIAMEETPITIHDARCLVTGFGRVAKTLAHDLDALGAKVTVCARKFADLAWIRALGYEPLPIAALKDRDAMSEFEMVFNTVPAVILTEEILANLHGECLVVDLASKPGGVDFETARRLGLRTVWALSVPGKVAPITAGCIIRDTILNILEENILEENTLKGSILTEEEHP
jgi:dipicolinate synthase subunit A